MKRLTLACLGIAIVAALLLASPIASEAGGRVFFNFTVPFGVGPWWWGPYPYYPYYGYPYYYSAPPVVVQQSPPAYVQQQPAPQQPSYWYYCPNPQGYYPYVKDCSVGWMTVVPPSAAPPGGPTSPPAPR